MSKETLVRCAHNTNIRKLLHKYSNGFEQEFPTFGRIINTKLLHATHRRKLTDTAKKGLLKVTREPIPDLYCNKILKYLNNEQLGQYSTIPEIIKNMSENKTIQ